MPNPSVCSRPFFWLHLAGRGRLSRQAALILFLLAGGMLCRAAMMAQGPSSAQQQIVGPIDDNQRVTLTGQTHPLARAEYDRGRVAPGTIMNDLVLVLKRTPEMQAEFDAFVASQYDENSPNYHHWLTPDEVGQRFGLAQSDISALSGWLSSQGFSIVQVAKDRMTIRFNGTAELVENAFQTEMHNLDVNGEKHIANMSDPQIPAALAPVVVGIKSLNNFFPRPLHHVGGRVRLNPSTHKWERVPGGPGSNFAANGEVSSVKAHPETVFVHPNGNTYEDVSPWDFATIYNVLPLWRESTPINGTGQTIYIAGQSNIFPTDIRYFQQTFGLPINPVNVIITNSDPGEEDRYTNDPYGDLIENTSDVEMADAIAPGANIVLVTSCGVTSANPCGASATSDGAYLSAEYIVNHGPKLPTSPAVMSYSYGECESQMYTDGSIKLYGSLWQTAAAEGLAVFVAAGDSGSAMCDAGATEPTDSAWVVATQGLAVNGMASTPYDTAVGGTDLYWTSVAPYWNTTNSVTEANATGYIPEQPWNDTCASPMGVYDLQGWWSQVESVLHKTAAEPTDAESACNFVYTWAAAIYNGIEYKSDDSLVNIFPFVGVTGGGGGKSSYVSQTLGTWHGYSKPSWQTDVTGIPDDQARDVPDVSFFAATGLVSGSAYLICVSTPGYSCEEGEIVDFQEVGGTSLSSPAMAGVMALINQKTGAPQGSPNAELYDLASKQGYSGCSAESVTTSSSCYFNDIDRGTNAPPCAPNSDGCTRSNDSDAFGIMNANSAGTGYDLATGLGSLNVANVVNSWTATPKVTVTAPETETTAQAFTVTVTVSGGGNNPEPTGTVTLAIGIYSIPAETLYDGSASFSIAAGYLAAGTYNLTSNYAPDSASSTIYNSATGTDAYSLTVTAAPLVTPTVTVNPSATSITAAQALSVGVTLSATSSSSTSTRVIAQPLGVCITHPPTGSVTITSGSYTSAAHTLNCGGASINIPAGSLSKGSDTLTATYTPDTGSSELYTSATGTATVTVTAFLASTTTTLTLSPNTVTAGSKSPVTLTATVAPASGSGTPTGTVTFYQGTTQLGQPVTLTSGAATYSYNPSSLPAGTSPFSVVYNGDTTYSGSTSPPVNLTVTNLPATTTVLTLSPTSIGAGSASPVKLKATVAPASGSGTPTGTVIFYQGTTALGQPVTLSSGAATYSYSASALQKGSYPFSAVYSGSTAYKGSTSPPVNLTVTNLAVTTTALTVTPNSITAGSSTVVAATATVTPASGSGTPTGTVTFFLGSTQLGQPVTLSDGVATYSHNVSSLAAGSYTITAVYSGDTTYATSTSPAVTLTVTTLATTGTTLTVAPNSIAAGSATPVALSATVSPASGSGTPTGTATFFNGTTQLGQPATISGGAASYSYNVSALAAGTYSISVVYSGDTTYAASTSAPVTLTVTSASNASFAITGSAVSVAPGAASGNTSTITVTPSGGFTGSVALTCALTSSPSGAEDLPSCSFGTTTPVSITSTTAGTATLTITTTAATSSSLANPNGPGIPWYAAGGATLACLLLVCVPTRQRRWRLMLGMFVLLVAMAGGVLSCGGGGNGGGGGGGGGNSGTTAGAYTLTVTGTSGTTTETGTVSLTVD